MNREQHRARERAKSKVQRQQEAQMEAQMVFLQTIAQNRIDAVGLLIGDLFEEEIGGGTFRLKGLGGASGVVTREAMDQAALSAAQSRALIPNMGQEPQEAAEPAPEATPSDS